MHELAELDRTLSSDSAAAPEAGERPDRRAPANRREHARYQITTTADFVDVKSGTRGSARSSDISLGGCFIDSTSPYAVGTRLRLRLSKDGRVFEALAEVVCALPGMGMGVKFVDAPPQAMRVVEEWIGELTGVAPRAPAEVPCAPVAPAQALAVGSGPASSPKPASQSADTRYLVMELIVVLMRNGVLDSSEGDHLLRRLI